MSRLLHPPFKALTPVSLWFVDANKHLLHDQGLPFGRQRHWSRVDHHVQVTQIEKVRPDRLGLRREELMKATVAGGRLLELAPESLAKGPVITGRGLPYVEDLAVEMMDVDAPLVRVVTNLSLGAFLA